MIRRALLPLTTVLVLAAGCGRIPVTPPAGPSVPGTYRVTRVTDGDTFHVSYAGHDERVRMIGIDTPEVPWYGGQGDCFGVQAAEYAKRRLEGRSVGLAFDAEGRDRYGRLLAYVYLGSEFLNLTLVQLGYARVETVPPNTRFEGLFDRAQSAARSVGLGRWTACPSG